MELKNPFKAFANRVMHALRMGKLNEPDLKTMERLFLKTEKKNLILSRALLTAFADGEQSEQDVRNFARLLELANRRITENKEPFASRDKKELVELFQRHRLSEKAAAKFALGVDELLAMELKMQINSQPIVPQKQKDNTVQKEKLAH